MKITNVVITTDTIISTVTEPTNICPGFLPPDQSACVTFIGGHQTFDGFVQSSCISYSQCFTFCNSSDNLPTSG
jgi:hypothetical protein